MMLHRLLLPAVLSCALALGCGEKNAEVTVTTGESEKPKTEEEEGGDPVRSDLEEEEPKDQEKPPPPAGNKVTSDKGQFEVVFPSSAHPKMSVQKVPTAAGEMETQLWMAEVSDGAYSVNYTDMPKELVAGTDAQKLLSGGRDGALRNMNSKVTKEEKFELDGHPGLRFWFNGSMQGMNIHGRIDAVFAAPRLYQVQYIGMSSGAVQSSTVTGFFDSFGFMGRGEGGPKLVEGPDGDFSVEFPTSFPEPTKSAEETEIPGGSKITITMLTSMTPRGAVGVGYSDMPEGEKVEEDNLDGARDGMMSNMNAKLDAEEKFTVNGNPARRLTFSGSMEGNDFNGRAELIGGGGRLYIVQALAPSKEQLADEQFAAFFESFKLLAKEGK